MGVGDDAISPKTEKGLEVFRLIPIAPETKIPDVEPESDYDFLKWQSEWGGTYPEYKAFRWLERHGYEPYEDFQFQSSQMGGRRVFGGAVVDFDFPWFPMAWRIQGEYWHTGDPSEEARDIMQKLTLESYGYTFVDIFAEDVV